LAEHADMIRTWWNIARDQVREDPDQALRHLVDAEVHLDIHVRIERVGALRRIRLASDRARCWSLLVIVIVSLICGD
jgi:hypothetical protein